jgi:hypothetical protein|tara:strand:+ start:119 stop:343 length:225 start_codon:yes stop_codon:yes gene_type:complete
MKPIQPNYTNDLRKISKQITELASEIQEIKKLLGSGDENPNPAEMYPWHFPNVTTTADYFDGEPTTADEHNKER